MTERKKAPASISVAERNPVSEPAAQIPGSSRSSLFCARDDMGSQDTQSKNAWGGRRRYCLTLVQEEEFLATWKQEARAGGIMSLSPIHEALVALLGHAVPVSTTYRLLVRHGWRKIQPDTPHPDSPGTQQEAKKNAPRSWHPPV